MNPDELTPLAKRDDDPFERALLRAAQRERAPEGVDRRVLAVLGVSGAAGAGALGAVLSKYTSWFGPKSVLVTVAIGASIAGVTHWVTSRDPDPPRAEPASLPAAAPIAEPLPAPEEARTETVASTRVEDLPSSQVPSPATRPPVAAPGASSPAKGAEPGSLAREVALVEAARAALARGDARSALRLARPARIGSFHLERSCPRRASFASKRSCAPAANEIARERTVSVTRFSRSIRQARMRAVFGPCSTVIPEPRTASLEIFVIVANRPGHSVVVVEQRCQV